MRKKKQGGDIAPQEFVEVLRELQVANQAWHAILTSDTSVALYDAASARVKLAEDWLTNWAREHA